jgi:hypothetical protein
MVFYKRFKFTGVMFITQKQKDGLYYLRDEALRRWIKKYIFGIKE